MQMICSRCKKNPAVVFITRIEGDKSTPEGLCLSCARELNIGPINQMMDKMGITNDDIEAVNEQFMELMSPEEEGFEPGGAATFPFLNNLFGGDAKTEEEKKEAADAKKNEKKKIKRKYLDTYCINLTEKARENKVDRIVGRAKEIYRVTQILCRRSKNNPCLIGEPGVGKTAIAEGLALKIASGDIPARLKDKEIHLLDLTALVAGTQFRGQFESRIKGLVDEVKSLGNIILFIDEVHNLVGTGDAEGSMNAANILKPALSRGEIQVIGATTFTEYRKHIEKDAALERRFQPVKVEEPSVQDTVEVLKGIKGYYEEYHHVQVSDALLYAMVVLSERYINDRFLPDKAIDLLDESCSCANLRNKAANTVLDLERQLDRWEDVEREMMQEQQEIDYEALANARAEILQLENQIQDLGPEAARNELTEDDIANVIQLWTGIPASKIKEDDLSRLANLESELNQKIIGQEEAVALVAAAVKRTRVQISPRRRPASFIFVGPTGVGKTELVKQLAKQLFDTPETLIRLDMSEFMEKHSVSRIIGSPPGYVGYDEAGQLTEKVRRKPYSLLLFDEIEKAHPDVMNILLQILDEGKITDAQGRLVNFENTVIIMTSNAGSEKKEGAMGFARTLEVASREKALKALSDFLRPEFLGRVDEIVVFRPLSQENFERIAVLMLQELIEPLKEKGIAFSWEEEAPKTLVKKAYGGQRGARDLRNMVRREVENKIASLLVEHRGDPITVLKLQGDEALTLLSL